MSKPDFPSEFALRTAADRLNCHVETIQAIAKVEAGPNGAFLDSGEPVILFEPHKFSAHTNHQFDGHRFIPFMGDGFALKADPEFKDLTANRAYKWMYISFPVWKPGWYGPTSKQHLRLQAAIRLDRDAALKSCSWGLYQLMGFNHKRCGHETIQSFVNAMYRSVDDHLDALVSFVLSSPKLTKAVRNRDAKSFARTYNGPEYAKNQYDRKLIEAGF